MIGLILGGLATAVVGKALIDGASKQSSEYTNEDVDIKCPSCGDTLTVSKKYAKKVYRCKGCRSFIMVNHGVADTGKIGVLCPYCHDALWIPLNEQAEVECASCGRKVYADKGNINLESKKEKEKKPAVKPAPQKKAKPQKKANDDGDGITILHAYYDPRNGKMKTTDSFRHRTIVFYDEADGFVLARFRADVTIHALDDHAEILRKKTNKKKREEHMGYITTFADDYHGNYDPKEIEPGDLVQKYTKISSYVLDLSDQTPELLSRYLDVCRNVEGAFLEINEDKTWEVKKSTTSTSIKNNMRRTRCPVFEWKELTDAKQVFDCLQKPFTTDDSKKMICFQYGGEYEELLSYGDIDPIKLYRYRAYWELINILREKKGLTPYTLKQMVSGLKAWAETDEDSGYSLRGPSLQPFQKLEGATVGTVIREEPVEQTADDRPPERLRYRVKAQNIDFCSTEEYKEYLIFANREEPLEPGCFVLINTYQKRYIPEKDWLYIDENYERVREKTEEPVVKTENHSTWDALLKQIDDEDVMQKCIAFRERDPRDVPDTVGYELVVDDEIVAEAEVAWTSQKRVILTKEQEEFIGVFEEQGWKVET